MDTGLSWCGVAHFPGQKMWYSSVYCLMYYGKCQKAVWQASLAVCRPTSKTWQDMSAGRRQKSPDELQTHTVVARLFFPAPRLYRVKLVLQL